MGDIADGIINGIFDEETGEYIDDELSAQGGPGYPRRMYNIKLTKAEKRTKAIRKELAILIEKKKLDCKTQKEINAAVNKARHEINLKYGVGWREGFTIFNNED